MSYKLYLRYNEWNETISDTYGEDGPYSGYTEEEKHVNFISLHKSQPKEIWYQPLDVDFDPSKSKKAYIVVVRYTDGGTFGCTHGYWVVKGVFENDDDAYKLKDLIQSGKYTGGNREYLEWTGYFSSLDNVEVHRMEIDE